MPAPAATVASPRSIGYNKAWRAFRDADRTTLLAVRNDCIAARDREIALTEHWSALAGAVAALTRLIEGTPS